MVTDSPIEKNQNGDDFKEGHESYGVTLMCWPSRAGMSVRPRERVEPHFWLKQENWAFASFVCQQCLAPYYHGMVECQNCGRRLHAITDMNIVNEPARLRRIAALRGEQANIIDLQPTAGLHKTAI